VHISFTWAGARKKTSFWTGKVGNVGASPTPTPPPTTPKPPTGDTTAPRPEPVPGTTLPPGADLVDETVTLPGTSAGVLTVGALTAGQPYVIEASGVWRWGKQASKLADAECSTTVDDPTWRRDRSVHTWQPSSDHLDLYVDGNDMAGDPDTDNGADCDTANHTYRWTYTPARTGRVVLASWDPSTLTDNSGALTIRVIKSAPVDSMTWTVPGTAGAGVTSPGALLSGETYVVTVTGTVANSDGVETDAECSRTPMDPSWQHNRLSDPNYPGIERLDTLIDHRATTFSAGTNGDSSSCDLTNHAYRTVVKPQETRPINVRVDDLTPADNVGALTVTATRVVQPTGPETVTLDTTVAAGAQTARTYLSGQALTITATGTYTYDPTTTSDAECTSPTASPSWLNRGNSGDITIGGSARVWLVGNVATCDATNHAYSLTYTPSTTGPLSFGLVDTMFSDNAGAVPITVTPVG
jgi:hypothetical protein